MYSFDSWYGVAVGEGIANGFQELGAFFARGAPNHPVRFPLARSVPGNHPFEANTPIVNRTARTKIPQRSSSLRRPCGVEKDPRNMEFSLMFVVPNCPW